MEMSNPHAESITQYADLFLNNRHYISGTNKGTKLHTATAGNRDLKRVLVDYGQASRGFRIMDRYSGESKLTVQRVTGRNAEATRHIIALSLLGPFDPKDTPGHEVTIVEENEVYRTLLPETEGYNGRRGGLILEPFNNLDRPVLANPNVIVATPRYAEAFVGRLAIVAGLAGLA
jgi:hypothetical protein